MVKPVPALPAIYVDADPWNFTPFCTVRERFGISFCVPGQDPVRFAITREAAEFYLDALKDYVKSVGGDQSPQSRLMPSEPMSVPSAGGNVLPPATSSTAATKLG